VPVVPPARVLLAEQDHQERREQEEATAADRDGLAAPTPVCVAPPLDACGEDDDRDRDDDPERRCEAVEVAFGILDRILQRIVASGWLRACLHGTSLV